MEEIKECLVLFPGVLADGPFHDVLRVYFAVGLKDVIIEGSLGYVLSKDPYFTDITSNNVI